MASENNNHNNELDTQGRDGEMVDTTDYHEEMLDSSHVTEDDDHDPSELENIKERVREMEEEAEKLRQMQGESALTSPSSTPSLSSDEKMEIDARSIYVGNVDYSATGTELEKHFHGCGSINRVTILSDKYNGHPKGFAYIEFSDKDSVETAAALNNSLFKGRQIKVNAKRTNRPGISTTNRAPRRGAGGRGGMGRGYAPRPSPYGLYNPRGMRRGYRSRGIRGGFGW